MLLKMTWDLFEEVIIQIYVTGERLSMALYRWCVTTRLYSLLTLRISFHSQTHLYTTVQTLERSLPRLSFSWPITVTVASRGYTLSQWLRLDWMTCFNNCFSPHSFLRVFFKVESIWTKHCGALMGLITTGVKLASVCEKRNSLCKETHTKSLFSSEGRLGC